MPELRWILIAFGLALLIGIYAWGRRNAKSVVADDDSTLRARPDPVFEPASSYEEFERPLVAPIEDVEVQTVSEESIDPPRTEMRPAPKYEAPRYEAPRYAADESQEPTIEARVDRSYRDPRSPRIEPTFHDAFHEESVTAELPVDDAESMSTRERAETTQAPTLSMSNTPQPRRIERRKIIALRLAVGPQRLNGTQLRNALEAEGLQHGRFDVFHRVDEQGAAIFSVASMVEPGTFDLEKMPQENFPGVTLFTQLPASVAGMLAFNELIACSRRLHAVLGGTLQDERGVPLTVHRIERIRQEIREFEHRPTPESQRANPTVSPTPP
jgi:cell division protein ZipA